MDANQLLTKLNNTKRFELNKNEQWSGWTLEEQLNLLQIYLLISKHETKLMDLVYEYHDCDSWEDIFRDYDVFTLRDKEHGIKIALDNMMNINQK